MPTLRLEFLIRLDESLTDDKYSRPNGPLFHRWLPDGEQDAISLPSPDEDTFVRVWFKRQVEVVDEVRVPGGPAEPSLEAREQAIAGESALFSGPMGVLMTLRNLSDEDIRPLVDPGDHLTTYVPLGKRVEQVLATVVAPFIDRLRLEYGQYWLPRLERWDTRTGSLGYYFMQLGAVWALDDGDAWQHFLPDPIEIRGYSTFTPHSVSARYLTRSDWNKLRDEVHEPRTMSIASELAYDAVRLLDDQNYRFAIIQVVTALEAAVGERLDAHLKVTTKVVKKSQGLRGRETHLPQRLLIATMNLPNVVSADLDATLDIIDVRNNVIHQSVTPSASHAKLIPAVCRVIDALIDCPQMRVVSRFPAKSWLSPADWEDVYQGPQTDWT